jgi:hypothetical protein
LVPFIHACNLLVGFPYFMSIRQFNIFYTRYANRDSHEFKSFHTKVTRLPPYSVQTVRNLMMDRYGRFWDLVMVEDRLCKLNANIKTNE